MPEHETPEQSTITRETLVPRAERVVTFYGDDIAIALVGDVPYVALRVVTDYLGLNWAAQYQRTERDDVLAAAVCPVLMTGADGRQREMVGLPLEYLPGWLFGVSPHRVRPELREKVIRYRRYCFQVLWREVQTELLSSGALAASVSSSAPASSQAVEIAEQIAEQITMLTDVITLLREHLGSLVALPGQVEGISAQLDQAVSLLESLVERQDTTETQVAKIDARTKRLTPAHARTIQEAVDRMVRETRHLAVPLTYATIYGRLKHRFRAGSYKEIPDERFDDVMASLRDELSRATGGAAPEQGNLF